MPIIDVHKDLEALTMTVSTEHAAAVDRVWQMWADPRRLERWWGPPTHPATVTEHELRPGGVVQYYMTGPEGERYFGRWDVTEVEAPRLLGLEDRFADEQGAPDPGLPVTLMRVTLAEGGAGTRMAVHSTYQSREAMDQVLAMGVEEGMKQAVGQLDDLLAE